MVKGVRHGPASVAPETISVGGTTLNGLPYGPAPRPSH
jgi:hypothetical protein